MAFVARATLESERTKILARVNAVSNIGLVLGPALNLGFVYIDFTVGPFHVSPLTVPAYVMVGGTCTPVQEGHSGHAIPKLGYFHTSFFAFR